MNIIVWTIARIKKLALIWLMDNVACDMTRVSAYHHNNNKNLVLSDLFLRLWLTFIVNYGQVFAFNVQVVNISFFT